MVGQTPMTANPGGNGNPNDTKPISPADDSNIDEVANANLMALLKEVGVKDFKVVRSA